MLSISDTIHFYNNIGYIFRYELDKDDRSVKPVINKMIVDIVPEWEKEYLKIKILKEGVTKQRAPYKISLDDTEIHVYTAQNNVTVFDNFTLESYTFNRIFRSDKDRIILFLNEDYVVMDPVGLNYDKDTRFDKILKAIVSFYNDIFITICGFSHNTYLSFIFSSLFLIQTLDVLDKDSFIEAFCSNFHFTEYFGSKIWDLCNKIIDESESARGIPFINTMKSMVVQDLITGFIYNENLYIRRIRRYVDNKSKNI